MRHWALAGGVALVVAFISASVITLVARGHLQGANSTSASPSQSAGPGNVGAPNVASPAAGGAWMGVEMRRRTTGEAVIKAVIPGSPADVGGLRPGDVILGIDNTSVTSTADVTAALARLRPGQVVPVSASRGTAGFTAQVTLAAPPRGNAAP
jgi:S1-C subfamily serine protease